MQKLFVLLCSIFLLSNRISSQVNSQLGAAQFNLPIFNFSDALSGLGHSVSINYFSNNGLKVNDIPSALGQGWTLIAGGSITRKQNGEPDDQNSTSAFPTVAYNNTRVFNHDIAAYTENYQSFPVQGDCYSQEYVNNYYPNGFLYSEFPVDVTDNFPLSSAAPKELGFLPRFKNNMDKRYKLSKRAMADREQDIFIFNFNGMSGEFVIGKNGEIVTLINSKLRIEKVESDMTSSNILTRINSFKITDEKGIVYTFSAMSLSEVLTPAETSNSGGDFALSTTGNTAIGKYTVDQWMLTSIKNPFTNAEATFAYTQTDVNYVSQSMPTYNLMEHDSKEAVNLHEIRIKGKVQMLQTINFPDGYSVVMVYESPRQDIPDARIIEVQVKYNNSLVNKYVFGHSYFFKKDIRDFNDVFIESDKRFLRLALTSVQKQAADGTADPAYQFTYYTGSESTDPSDIVPPMNCYAQDHWGFYNKSSIVDITQATPAKEVFKDLMVNAGSYRNVSTGIAKFGLLKTIKNPMGGEMTYEYEQNSEVITVNGQPTSILTGGVHVSLVKQYDGINHSYDIITNYSYSLEDGSSSAWGYEAPVYGMRREIQIIKDMLNYKYAGEQVVYNTGALQKKGLKEIWDQMPTFNKVMTILKVANTIYNIATISEGSIRQWVWAYMISNGIQYLYLLFDPYDYDYSNAYQFYPLNYNNTIGKHYSRIVISNNAASNGKVVSEFSKPSSIATEIASNSFPYSQKQRYAYWEFDQLKKESIYNTNNTLIKETTFSYNIVKTTLNTIDFLSNKVQPNYLRSARWEAMSSNFPVSDLSSDPYYPITGRTELTSSMQKNYSSTGILSETTSTVQFNNDYLPNSTTTLRSNGDQIITKTYYANDYNSSVSTAIQQLKTKYAYGVPVAVETWLKRAITNDEYLIDATINEFVVLPNNDIKVGKIYALESKTPLAKSIIQDWNANTLVRNTTYFKVQREFNYNADGNLIETLSSAGEIASSIFDYNKRLVTASISNATAASVAYTSFESENKGGWIYDNGPILTGISRTPTGDKSFSMPSGPGPRIICNLTMNRDYLLSFWAKTDAGIPVVNGSTTLLKTSVVNEWTYYEYKINQGSASPTLDGPGIIDELRLYPANAKMSTVTYNPILGKTSECDMNNRIQYYEYDGFGRLVKVRDEKRNLIKTYEYHFKN